jgi:hypothetical protein
MQRRSLDFHIRHNDYFGTLATALDLLGQNLRKEGHIRIAEMLGRLRDDLMYLQRSYRIEEVLPSKCCGSVVQKKNIGPAVL